MMEPISIRYRLSEAEFMKACNAHWSAHHQSTLFNTIAGGLGIVVGLAVLSLSFLFAVLLCVVGGLLLLLVWLRFFLWRRAFREGKKYTADIDVVFGDDTIHVESVDGKSDLYWTFYTKYMETPDQFLLYLSKHQFSVIPKKSFSDDQIIGRFLELLDKKLKKV